MRNYFYGTNKRHSYFEGWYLKQQNQKQTVAFIPAYHVNKAGDACASLQVITNKQAYHIPYTTQDFYASPKQFFVQMGQCHFSANGCTLHCRTEDCKLDGTLRFGPFSPVSYDIMGPFQFVPFMQCRHSVFSLYHRVDGVLHLNGQTIVFDNGTGYIEGDRGYSFPKQYIWTQCSWKQNSIMISVAHIPFGFTSFTGCIGCIYVNKKEYRIATYLGVKLLYVRNHAVVLQQGDLILKIRLLESRPHLLRAPKLGGMTRMIRESASCRVRYTCKIRGRTLFDFISEQASFESNWDAE